MTVQFKNDVKVRVVPSGIKKNGLILNLDAGDITSYPGTGSTWYDISGQGNHATLYGAPTFINSNNGILSFDEANNDYARFTLATMPVSAYTISIWMNVQYYNGTETQLFTNNDSSGMSLLFGNFFSWQYAYNTDGAFSTNTWYNWIITVDSTLPEFKMYVNGTLVDGPNVNGQGLNDNYAQGCSIGAFYYYGASRFYTGYIGNFLIYNRVLSDSELTYNFNFLRGRYGV